MQCACVSGQLISYAKQTFRTPVHLRANTVAMALYVHRVLSEKIRTQQLYNISKTLDSNARDVYVIIILHECIMHVWAYAEDQNENKDIN